MIVLMAGLPGTGKTTLARELALRTAGRVLSKDNIRHALFTPEEIKYSSRQDDFCLQIMMEMAAFLLRQNLQRIIFLDGRPFSQRYQIENVVNFAASLQQPWRVLECVCSEKTARRRIEEQGLDGKHPAGNRDYQMYLDVKARFEAITHPKAAIDSEHSLEECLEKAFVALS